MKCRKCNSTKSVKNGQHLGKQRYKCSQCGYQFTRETPKGIDPSKKANAILLYILGLSMNAIAQMYEVNTSTVMRWIRNFALKVYEKPTPAGDVVIELDEMWHFIHSKKQNAGFGRHIAVLPVNWSTGNAEVATVQHSQKCSND